MADFVKGRFHENGFTYFLENVKGSKLKTALKSGLRKSLSIIKKRAVSNLRGITFKNRKTLNTTKYVLFKNNYGESYVAAPFGKAITIKLKKDGSGGRVQIINRHDDKNWNPILTMMETSKGKRETTGNSHKGIKGGRKAHSTGSIAHTFFTNAVQSTKSEVQQSLQTNLEDAITRARERFSKQ